jgi:hypothetical protein
MLLSDMDVMKMTPYYLMFGREQFVTSDIAQENIIKTMEVLTEKKIEQLRQSQIVSNLHKSIKEANNLMKKSFKRNQSYIKVNDPKFIVGDKVWFYFPSKKIFDHTGQKLNAHWIGPLIIEEIQNEVNVILKTHHGYKIRTPIHMNRIKPFRERDGIPSETDIKGVNSSDLPASLKREIQISQIVGTRISVYWPTEKRRFIGTVKSYDAKKRKFNVLYDWDNEEYGEILLGNSKNVVDWRYLNEGEMEDYSDAIDLEIRKHGPKHLRKEDSRQNQKG